MSSSTVGVAPVSTCVPGASSACVGAGGCTGFQTCNDDGRFAPCVCSSSPDASATDATIITESGTDGAAIIDSGVDVADYKDAADAGPFSPTQLAGLVVWFEGDVGVIADPLMLGAVKRWLDPSGLGNDATQMSTPDPTVDPSVRNGHSAIVCGGNGSWLNVVDGPSVLWGTGNFGISMVVRNDTTSGGTYWSKNSGVMFYFTPAGASSAYQPSEKSRRSLP